jgi:hypothetical protein
MPLKQKRYNIKPFKHISYINFELLRLGLYTAYIIPLEYLYHYICSCI